MKKKENNSGFNFENKQFIQEIQGILKSKSFDINELQQSLQKIEEEELEKSLQLFLYILLEENLTRVIKDLNINKQEALNLMGEEKKDNFLEERVICWLNKTTDTEKQKTFLQRITDNDLSEQDLNSITSWIKIAIHKGVKHPQNVYELGMKILSREKGFEDIDRKIAMIVLFWHDIGRFGNDLSHEENYSKGETHGRWSKGFFDSFNIKNPLIVLPIKYHCDRDDSDFVKDPLYTNMNKKEKETSKTLLQFIQVVDRLENLVEFSKLNKTLSGQKRSPQITQQIITGLESERLADLKYLNSRLDSMIRYMTWCVQMQSEYSKNMVEEEKIVEGLWTNFLIETALSKSEKNIGIYVENELNNKIFQVGNILLKKGIIHKEELIAASQEANKWLNTNKKGGISIDTLEKNIGNIENSLSN